MTDMTDVFASYGRAAHYAQLIEYDLISIWMLDSVTQGVSVTRADLVQFQGDWSKKTLGKLLHPLRQSPLLPGDLKQFLEVLRKTRNTLAHDFYLTVDADLRTSEGRDKAVTQLGKMVEVLIKGHELFRDVLATYGKDFGIDHDKTLKELLREDSESI